MADHQPRYFQCTYCGAVFRSEDALDIHIDEEAELADLGGGAHAVFIGDDTDYED